jgi:hypothetical protein
MDLSQTKLSKSEWGSVEIPVSDQEQRVLKLIIDGYKTPDIRTNRHKSLLGFMKIEPSEEMDYFLYKTHFLPVIEQQKSDIVNSWKRIKERKIKTPNKPDMIRIQNLTNQIVTHRRAIFDFVLLDYSVQALNGSPAALYTLLKFRGLAVKNVNRPLLQFVDHLLASSDTTSAVAICGVVGNAHNYIEKNKALMEYDDDALYTHQRDLFRLFSNKPSAASSSSENYPLENRQPEPKCVLYMAPTGTGKTLSPIGLSEKYRVIFVCAARHVGLALAKSAISVGKRVAFAFGCETASDIRLHYFAAADYTINKRSGGIYKVDNSNGSRVEIMICDVASYLVAMYYMKVFNSVENMIMYWDEPTIGMDKEDDSTETAHLHGLINRVWSMNQIPNVILSCATLPKPDEIGAALQDFRAKFAEIEGEIREPEIHVIDSHDCKKTISLLAKDGKIALPHLLFEDYQTLISECVEHCETNKSILRYFDVVEIVRFIEHVQPFLREGAKIESRFKTIDAVTLHSLKQYYLFVLREVPAELWPAVYQYMTSSLSPRFSNLLPSASQTIRKISSECTVSAPTTQPKPLSRQTSVSHIPSASPAENKSAPTTPGILLTTSDAHTLTDGPTIYLAEDVEKIGRFYIQQSNIPESVFSSIQQKIERNNLIMNKVQKLEDDVKLKTASTGTAAADDKSSKKAEREPASREVQQMLDQIKTLRDAMQTIHLNSVFIPNTKPHLDVWRKVVASSSKKLQESASIPFTPNVDEEDVREIMALEVENQQKLLLILGIGVFSKSTDKQYAEIMKRLAYEQRLFLIIASSDYIYGTNYQFCHGFVGRDLANMTQQKTVQAIGRIGRNNIQQEYTVRFRDDEVLMRLFKRQTHNLEADAMNRLFSSEE